MIKPYHVVNALVPAADAFAGTVTSSVISLKEWNHCSFIIQCGVGDLGQSVITVEACDDIVPTNTEAIPFKYQECLSGDIFNEIKDVTTTGFTTTAGSNKMYKIEVPVRSLPEDKPYVRIKGVETVDGAVAGSILAVLSEPRYGGEIADTVLT